MAYSKVASYDKVIKKHQWHAIIDVESIDNQLHGRQKQAAREEKQRLDQKWTIKFIERLQEEFANEPDIFASAEKYLFSKFGKYERWRERVSSKQSVDNNIFFYRTFSRIHTDVQRMKEKWQEKYVKRALNVLQDLYLEYEKESGEKVEIFSIERPKRKNSKSRTTTKKATKKV